MSKDGGIFGNDLQTDKAILDWFGGLQKDEDEIDLKAVSEKVSKRITPQFIAEHVELDEGDGLEEEIQGNVRKMLHGILNDDREMFEAAFEAAMLGKIVQTLEHVKQLVREEWVSQFKS
jgi:hypothetical protein